MIDLQKNEKIVKKGKSNYKKKPNKYFRWYTLFNQFSTYI